MECVCIYVYKQQYVHRHVHTFIAVCCLFYFQVLATSIEENYVSKTLSVQETIASLKTPVTSFVKTILRRVIPLCRKAVTLREMTKNVTISAVHILRLAYRRLGTLMVAESYIPDERLIFFLTHQEIGQLLDDHNPLLVRK